MRRLLFAIILVGAVLGAVLTTSAAEPAQAQKSSKPASTNQSSDPVGLNNLANKLYSLIKVLPTGEPDPKSNQFTPRILNIVNFMLMLAGAVMALASVWSGLLYIFSMGNEETAGKAKKNFINILIGLVVLLMLFSISRLIYYLITTGSLG